VKNVTVSLDDETYLRARVKAAEAGRSLSAIVRDFLRDLGSGRSEFERLHKQELALREQIGGFSAGDLLSRDQLHERRP
jgi:plasmid stability protein